MKVHVFSASLCRVCDSLEIVMFYFILFANHFKFYRYLFSHLNYDD